MSNMLQIQYENYHATAYKIIPKQHLAKLNSLHDYGTKRKCCKPFPHGPQPFQFAFFLKY